MTTTYADRALTEATTEMLSNMLMAKIGVGVDGIKARRDLVPSVRACVRAARDVERQRAFERGIEAMAAMPWVSRDYLEPDQKSRYAPLGTWTGD